MSSSPSLAVAAESSVPADKRWLDRIGIGASVACAIHCIAAPFLMLLLPAAGATWSHPAVHWLLAVLVLPLALWVIYCGYRKHRKRLTLVAAGFGAALIFAGLVSPMFSTRPVIQTTLPAFSDSAHVPVQLASTTAPACVDECCPSVTHNEEAGTTTLSIPPGGLLTLLGSLLLVFAHASNLIACRCISPSVEDDAGCSSGCGCPTASTGA